MKFKRLTAQQRETLKALRALGWMVVNPNDARQLAALKRRGLVRYKREGGVRVAVLRDPAAEAAEKRRERRWRMWDFWKK